VNPSVALHLRSAHMCTPFLISYLSFATDGLGVVVLADFLTALRKIAVEFSLGAGFGASMDREYR
jgi:hypothetical protein